MSYQDGMAALNLEMPPRIPRTEYSADQHWDLINAVTGIKVSPQSPDAERQKASQAFVKKWNYDFWWSILVYRQPLEKLRTDMGHAEYAAGAVDFHRDIKCPFKTPEEVLAFDPMAVYGPIDKKDWTRQFEEQYRQNSQNHSDLVNMTGIYITCVSGLIEIFGWDMLLLAAGTDMRAFGAMTNRYAAWMQQYFDALAEAKVPVVMVHDDIVWTSGAFLSPKWYREFVFPNYKKYFAPLRDSGKKIMYTSDGNFTEFIDDVVATGVHGLIMEPTTDMAYVAERYGKTHAFFGNADTRILLDGTKAQIKAEVERCIGIGKNCPGFFMAVGNHIPANTPVENALYYNEIYEKLSHR